MPFSASTFQDKWKVYKVDQKPVRLQKGGGVPILTPEMEKELCRWIYIVGNRTGDPSPFFVTLETVRCPL